MINFFKKIFQKTKPVDCEREYTSIEKMELRRLELHRKPSYSDGFEFYIERNSIFKKVLFLGRYAYEDVDGTVYGRICKTTEGEIINTNWMILYNKKPHEWFDNLSEPDRMRYLSILNTNTYEEIYDEFYNKLDKSYQREEKLKQLGI